MSASALVRSTNVPKPLSEQVTHASHRFLLPVVGGTAAALGSLALLGRSISAGPIVPITLVGLGAATVGSSIAFLHWQSTHRARRAAATPAPAADPDPFPSPFPHHVSFLAAGATESRAVPHSGIGRTAVSAATGDRIWQQWETRPAPGLGAPLTGPVPEMAFVPSRRPRYDPFADRDTDLVRAPSELVGPGPPLAAPTPLIGPDVVAASIARPSFHGRPRSRGSRRVPFSDAELDVLFPPASPSAVSPGSFPLASGEISPVPAPRAVLAVASEGVGSWPPGPSAPVGAPSADRGSPATREEGTAPPDEPSGRYRILPSLLSLRDPLYVETIHPIPPHLRSSIRARESNPDARSASTLARSPRGRSACVGCFRSLRGFRGWVVCPGCHQPLCRRCLGASFLASSEGYCSACRPWQARTAN